MKTNLISLLLLAMASGCMRQVPAAPTNSASASTDRAIAYLDPDLEGRSRPHYFDLNGDGKPDTFETYRQGCGTGGCPWEIRNGASGRVAGEIFGDPVYVLMRRVNGWSVLGTYAHANAGSGSFSTYTFDGMQYKLETSIFLEGCDPIAALLARLADAHPIP